MALTKQITGLTQLKETWGTRVRRSLDYQGRSVKWLAEKLDIDASTLSSILSQSPKYQKGKVVDPAFVSKIGSHMGIPPDYFLEPENASQKAEGVLDG